MVGFTKDNAFFGGGVPPTCLCRVLRTLRQNIEEKLTTS